MELTYAEICVSGPVRPNNEDRAGFWQPETANDRRDFGAIALVADGVGGRSRGEVASAIAIQCALDIFCTADPATEPRKVLRQAFDLASRSIYDESLKNPKEGQMCTTLTACIFRYNEVTIGYAGDTRAYLIRHGKIERLTTDHNQLSFQLKYGLIREHDAMTSPTRSMLTRTVGSEPVTNFDVVSREVFKGDFIVQCTDGLYGFATDAEILDFVTHHEPSEATKLLLQLVEKRNGEDNISMQVIRIEQVDRAIFFRGVRTGYQKSGVPEDSEELAAGTVLDNRFEITERISRSGMACIYKARDRKTEQTVAIKVPFRHMEGDVAAATRFEREEEIGKSLNHPSILKIIPVEEQKSRPYIVMELLDRPNAGRSTQGNQGAPGGRCRGHRQPDLRRTGLSAQAERRPPRPQTAEHHAVRRRLHPRDGFWHLQIRPGPAHDFRGLHSHDGHARLHGPRASPGQTRRRAH